MKYLSTAMPPVLGAILAANPAAGESPFDQVESAAIGRCETSHSRPVSDSAISVRRLIGTRVTNPINERIGEVSDLVLDQCGRIESITVHIGGFLGVGGRYVRLPLDRTQIRIRSSDSAAGMALVVRQTRDHILSGGDTVSQGDGGD